MKKVNIVFDFDDDREHSDIIAVPDELIDGIEEKGWEFFRW